jgi:hypothetical protein
LRREDGVHWWENCRLITQREDPHCLSIEMGGVIPLIREEFDEMLAHPGYTNTLLHKHNWLNGHLYARLHSNGVCEIYLRHVNSRFVDDGGDLADARPVVGIRTAASSQELSAIAGRWDGGVAEFAAGGVRFDISEPARLVSASQPGDFQIKENGQIVWQPYSGVEIYGGICPTALTGDPFVFRAEQKIFPRGMARTLRFSLSLSDRSPRVVRYLAPAWWHGLSEDFLPAPLLPVKNEYDETLALAREWVRTHTVHGGFEDGAVARNSLAAREVEGRKRYEAGWEGETPYAQFLSSWRTGNAEEYFSALRSAYHFTDIAIDHSSKLVRMHGFPNEKISQPMSRVLGTVAAYLETGDPFLKTVAESVTANAHWVHKNSWPRLCVGRDACYIRSAVLLFRYFGDDFYRKIALDGATDTILSQRDNGSFGDQGGGARLHGWNAYITKPWMGLLALNGVLDYLELFPDEPLLTKGVLRFADWLIAERLPRFGRLTWAYQHDFNGKRQLLDFYRKEWIELPSPDAWHQETLGRLLTYASLTTGRDVYFKAWAESRLNEHPVRMDHAANAILQFIPWVQAKLWNARISDGNLKLAPVDFGPLTPDSAEVMTPWGDVVVTKATDDKAATRHSSKSIPV